MFVFLFICLQLTTSYLTNRDNFDMQVTACRLVLVILPGIETSLLFETVSAFIFYSVLNNFV